MGRPRVVGGALALLATATLATGWVVLPPADPSVLAALETVAADTHLPWRTLPAADVLQLRPPAVAVLAGGEGYLDTVAEAGDAARALRAFVASGGSLLVFGSGRFGRRATGPGWVQAGPFPLALAHALGLADAGGAVAGGPWRVAHELAGTQAWPPHLPPLDKASPRGVLVASDGWRLRPWLLVGASPVVAELRPPAGDGRVVWAWSGLLAPGHGARLVAGLTAVLHPAAASDPNVADLSESRRTLVDAWRRGPYALGLEATLSALEAELIRLEVESRTVRREAFELRVANLGQRLAQTCAALPSSPAGAPRKGSHPMVEVVTNKGRFELELFEDVAPAHVANLLQLARSGFYDGLHVHRVEPGFVVQFGCPHTRQNARDPRAGQGGPGYTVKAEFSDRPHLRGTLGMARASDPDSAGSQVYICLDTASFLDGKYTVFGRVTGDGMAVVDALQVGDEIEKVGVLDD